jgi:histidine triad (HIT) family protein
MEATIFSKILSGDIPSHKVYEDDLVYAFLDINPLSDGHTLVIPKEAKASMHELSDDSMAALGRALPRICRAVMQVSGCEDYNLLQNNGAAAGQSVFHVHFHVIPRPGPDAGLRLDWRPGSVDHEVAAEMAKAIADHIDGGR